MKNILFLLYFLLLLSCKKDSPPDQTQEPIHVFIEDSMSSEVKQRPVEMLDTNYTWKLVKVDSDDLLEANTYFTFKGKFINPMLVKSFVPWISDPAPSFMALDVMTSNDANLFYSTEGIQKNEDGYVFVRDRATYDDSFNKYRYKWLGMLKNKIHILKYVEDNEESSGVFISLLFVQFELADFRYNGIRYTQLLMKNKGGMSIGDRVESIIDLDKENNCIYVKTKEFNVMDAQWEKEKIQL
jgi:hypothetical protein